jgi:filamentous hemagglutinin family protein
MSVRTALLSGVSCVALLIEASPVHAGPATVTVHAGTPSAAAAASAAAQANAAQAAALAAQSQQSMTVTVRAIQQMMQTQAAARALAITGPNSLASGLPTVTDGLGGNGLNPDSALTSASSSGATTTYNVPSSWQNIGGLSQTLTQNSNGTTTTTVNLNQTSQQAIANWSTFNVGKNTVVDFNQQGNQSWVVLNRILDPSGVPSQILGQIKADGQVLLINQNGIIFGGSSQINVHTLIASTLDVAIVGKNGLDTNPTDTNPAFLQNGLFSSPNPIATSPTAGLKDAALFAPTGSVSGAITVQPGAVIDTTHNLTAAGDGGYVALLGAAVANQGTITTQNGQIILAADSKQIALVTPPATAIGPQTALQVQSLAGGAVINDVNGLLVSNDGAVTLAGGSIQQLGGIEATTSVTRTGSILLNATSATANAPNDIVLGPASVTAILPDETSGALPTATATNATIITANGVTGPYLQPQIVIQATGSVDVQGNGAGLGGALIKAPGAALVITAGFSPPQSQSSTPALAGTVLLEPGSTIDLSGIAGVTLPMSINEVVFSKNNANGLITTADVADTPLASSLIGQSVTIDARLSGTRADGLQWVGSPLLDVAGFVGLIPQTIDQVLTTGGSFTAVGKNVIQQPGSVINISGGSVNYLGGVINTTWLLGANGRLYNIGSADPTIAYVGVASGFTVDHPRWGVTETWAMPQQGFLQGQFQPGYVAGANAGSVSVTALNPILEGSIVASVVAGDRQRALAGSPNLAPSDQMPVGAALNITFENNGTVTNSYNVVMEPRADAGSDPYGLIAGGFSFSTASTWTPVLANATPGVANSGTFPIFSDVLTSEQLNAVSIKGGNQLSVAADATLSVRPGGSITFDGVSTIDGTLNAPSGSISLTGFTYANGSSRPEPPPTPAVVIGSDAVLNVRGLWVNDTGLTPAAMQGPGFINGGSVSITTIAASKLDGNDSSGNPAFADATQSIVLSPGSVTDVSGGGYVGATGRLKLGSDGLPAGKGGSVTLTTYSELTAALGVWTGSATGSGGGSSAFNVVPTFQTGNVPNQANVSLGGTIYAQSFDGGGTFSLQVPTITIDGATTQVTSYLSSASATAVLGQAPAAVFATSDQRAGEVVLPPSFFTSGFSQYTLTSTYGSTTVTAGTQLVLRESSFLPAVGETQMPTGAMVRSFAPSGFLPDGLRKPVSLTLAENAFVNAPGDNVSSKAGVLLDSGASIVADPQATVTLVAAGPVTVLGSITAHGGVINLVNDPPFNSIGGNGSLTAASDVWIGPKAVLDVSGTFVPNPQVTAFSSGTVLDGGTITLGAGTSGAIVVQPGAQLNLQGALVAAAGNLIQVPNASPGGPRLVSLTEWSNGGNLQLAAPDIYFAGTVNAAGGAPQATGGTLTVGNVAVPGALTGIFGPQILTLPGPNAIVVEPAGVIAANLPGVSASPPYPLTPSDLSAMTPFVTNADGSVTHIGGAFIGADTLSNSGFDSANLTANNTIAFNGSVTVSLPGALTLRADHGNFVLLPSGTATLLPGVIDPASFVPASCGPAGSCIPSIGGATVNLNAGYVRVVGSTANGTGIFATPPNVADGTLNVTAQWIDLERAIALDNVGNANLTSTGAIRLLPDNYGFISGRGSTVPNPNPNGGPTIPQTTFGGALVAPGNLTLTAAEIFPVSNTQFLLMSTGTLASDSTLTVKQNGAATAPLSAGGTIVLDAQTIVQNGTLWVPLGSIVLGLQSASQIPPIVQLVLGGNVPPVVTQNVTLGDGSLTSVSAAGLDIPDGFTIDSTTAAGQTAGTWYQGAPTGNTNNPATVLTAPPAKSIGIFGTNVATQKGAVIDLSGGGDIYATEFVAGTGGTRNVLTTYEQNLTTGLYTPQYADGRQVYALVPGKQAGVAAYDPNFADFPYYSGVAPSGTALSGFNPSGFTFNNAIAPGTSITIAPGSGIPAGTYTLLPGMYATLPGAYRVVQVAGNANPTATTAFTGPDGSQYISGTFGNALTGARSSQQALFQLQSQAVWQSKVGADGQLQGRYSQIIITSGTSFFSDQATTAGNTPPPLPIDGGVLAFGATGTLSLLSTNRFAPGISDLAAGQQGAGGQVQISASNMLILAADQAVPAADAGYLVLDADQVSNLGATSVLIGGTAVPSSHGVTITANAQNLEVLTDAAHPLTGPELILVTQVPGTPNGPVNGLTVDAGSVIRAVGAVPPNTSRNITIGALAVTDQSGNVISPAVSGDGALLRVSNGSMVTITRINVPANPVGQITIGTTPGTASLVAGASVMIAGNALTVDTSGNSAFAPASSSASGVTLAAQNYDLSASAINIGNPGDVSTTGLVLDPGIIAGFAGANSVQLRSASVFNLFDAGGLSVGDSAHPIGTLTFDGAGLFSQGGTTTINATNVVLTDSQATPNTNGALSGTAPGTLSVNAGGTFTQGAGAVVLGNFGQVNLTAGQAIAFTGAGSVNAGAAAVSLSAPVLLVHGGSTQALTTTGVVSIAQGAAGTAPVTVSTDIGGALTITAAAITDSGTIQARSGNVTLNATTGDVELHSGALIDASGSHIAILDTTEDAPGGSVRLVSNTGNVTIDQGATLDVSATGVGYAGTVAIIAPNGQANLFGTLTGGAAFKDTGGNFALDANSLAGALPFTGFTGSFAVALQTGNIDVPAGTTLSSGLVNLTANTGSVTVEGTIDASGPSGGSIALYGAAGVTINGGAVLNASYQGITDTRDPGWANGTSTFVQNGGTIILGTTGTPTGSVDTTGCGGTGCGYELVASSGAITVAAGAILNVSGGPGTTNVPNNGGAISNNAGTIILHAPILQDGTVNVSFKGTVISNGSTGPNSGVVLNAYAVWSTTDATTGAQHFDGIIDPAGWFDANGVGLQGMDQNGNAITAPTPANPLATGQIFTVTTPNADHVGFYQTTLVNFVEGFAPANAASFNGIANMHLRPEIDLINPSTSVNNGNITVASNWNLGAGSQSAGGISLIYRTPAGEPGALTLRAVNNVQINATVSDGFFFLQSTPSIAAQAYNMEINKLGAYTLMFPNGPSGQIQYNCVGGVTCTVNDMFGSYFPLSLLGPFMPKPPTVFSSGDPQEINQYNQFYVQYINLFDVYQQEATSGNGFYAPPSTPATGSLIPPAAPTAQGTYYNFTTGAQPGTGTDYASLYENYVQATNKANTGSGVFGTIDDFCFSCIAYAPPFAPVATLVPVQPNVPTPPPPTFLSLPGNGIANNPAMANGTTYFNTTAAADLMPAGSGNSFSYNFVAGALFAGAGNVSVDPNAVVPVSALTSAVTGNVTINGHTSYADTLANSSIHDTNGNPLTIVIPTLVRTGTGSIMITAAGNVALLDTVAPGAVYTAGAATATPSDFTAPSVTSAYQNQPNGLLNTPTWATGGGSVAITAGQSITGIQTTIDTSQGSQTGIPNGPTGQLWSDWYYHSGLSSGTATPFANCPSSSSCQTAAWVNYATFFQGFGALGGGNVTLTAGRDIADVAASLPETVAVGGGTTASDPPHAAWFGGGNLVVNAGGNLLSSDFLVGRGAGLIRVGGSVQADPANPIMGLPTLGIEVSGGAVSGTYPLPLLLAAQDGFITVAARGSVTLGNVFDPASLPAAAGLLTDPDVFLPGVSSGPNFIWGNLFTTFGPTSGVSVTSSNGDVTALTVPTGNSQPVVVGLFLHNNAALGLGNVTAVNQIGQMLPAALDLVSISSNIDVNPLTPISNLGAGNASLVPYPTQAGNDTGTIAIVAGQSINLGFGLAMPDLSTSTGQFVGNPNFPAGGFANYISPLGLPSSNLTQGLHANDPMPVIIAANQDINAPTAAISVLKPAEIEAGRDITGLGFTGQNNSPTDITGIVAGRDLTGGSYVLYGPGTLLLQAGHNLGPFTPSTFTQGQGATTSGIATVGDGSAGGNLGGLTFKPYLPAQGAEIDVMFGVKGVQPVIDYAAAIAQYVNPANAGANNIDFLKYIANILGQSRDQAWATFQQKSQLQQHLLVNRAFLDLLRDVAKDHDDPTSQFFNQYGRAYAAIATLFPASLGYTNNASGGGSNGAAVLAPTGNLNLASSILETQKGGDINIVGPGGSITVGHTSLDTLNPSQEGILTLGGGTIRAYTDSSILLNQSRIMTLQGGDIDMFTANGGISAGSGPKTYVSDPPITNICDFNGFCFVNPSGLVTGAGIGALLTLPGQDPANSNVTLAAPHGTIDAGAAGLRGNNITLAALQVLNSFNIQATGTVTGLTFTPPPNVTGALSAQSTSGALQSNVAAPAAQSGSGPASVIIVQVIGYGGSGGEAENTGSDDQRRREQQQ